MWGSLIKNWLVIKGSSDLLACEFHFQSASLSLSHFEYFTWSLSFLFHVFHTFFLSLFPSSPLPLPYTLPPILCFFLSSSFIFLSPSILFTCLSPSSLSPSILSSPFLHFLPPISFFLPPSNSTLPPFLPLALCFLHSSPFTSSVPLSFSLPLSLPSSQDPIKQPMILTRDKQQKKDAVEMFKLVLQYMGDYKSKVYCD